MLSKRYVNNGRPTLKLNQLQLSTKEVVSAKVKEKIYLFEDTACAICNGHSFEALSEKDRYGLYMPVVICRDCGLIQTNPRMTQDSYNDFYNLEYRKLYGGSEKPTKEFLTKQLGQGRKIFNYVFPFLSKIKPPKEWYVIEVGCGAGGILKYFHDKGCQVTGIDLGEEYINYGITELSIDLRTGYLKDIQINRKPDLIIYSHVLEHILTPGDELSYISSIISDNGMLYIELPGVRNLSGSYRLDFLRMLQNAHVYHFSLLTLKSLLRKSGFILVAGDESIRSIFTKDENAFETPTIESDYPSILSFLKIMEIVRPAGVLAPSFLMSSARKIATLLLQKTKLYPAVKKLLIKL